MQVSPYDSLKDVAKRILQNEVATVPVIYSSTQDGSCPQLLHLASLSEILKCMVGFNFNCLDSIPRLFVYIIW